MLEHRPPASLLCKHPNSRQFLFSREYRSYNRTATIRAEGAAPRRRASDRNLLADSRFWPVLAPATPGPIRAPGILGALRASPASWFVSRGRRGRESSRRHKRHRGCGAGRTQLNEVSDPMSDRRTLVRNDKGSSGRDSIHPARRRRGRAAGAASQTPHCRPLRAHVESRPSEAARRESAGSTRRSAGDGAGTGVRASRTGGPRPQAFRNRTHG